MRTVCKFKLPDGTTKEFIEVSIAMAIFNAECVYGKARVRVSGVAYYVAEDGPGCVIDVSTEVGEHVAQVFTGMMMNVLGEDKFRVIRIEGEPLPAGRTK